MHNLLLAETQIFEVTNGSTYLLRLTNAGLNNNHFFKVANHTLTVVRADGNYLQPFTVDVVVISPGQTTDVLLTADQPIGKHHIPPISILPNFKFIQLCNSQRLVSPILPYVRDSSICQYEEKG